SLALYATYTSTTSIYTLSLHDALPISHRYFHPDAGPHFVRNACRCCIGCIPDRLRDMPRDRRGPHAILRCGRVCRLSVFSCAVQLSDKPDGLWTGRT